MTGDATFTVGELNSAIAEALVDAFPRQVWVRGEIQQLRTSRNGHAYFELIEKDHHRDRVRAALGVVLFRGDRPSVNRTLSEIPGVELGDGVEVRIRARVDFYPPAGRLQLVMSGIDPVFTMGKAAAERERVLRALAAEGLARRNAGLPLAPVPLRVGLVTSGGSAAYHDFVHELERSRFSFRVAHIDVQVQGGGAARRVSYAIRRLASLGLDVVVIVRGGGARSDLAAFDTEIVARAIAAMPVPVITGIGHEVDRTVADEVAHTACKTPTAAAAALVDRVDGYCTHLARVASRVALRARSACTLASRMLESSAQRAARAAPATLEHERRVVGGQRRRATEATRRAVRGHGARLSTAEARLRALDPRRVLERGYTITRTAPGQIVRSAGMVDIGDELRTETAAGAISSRVESVDDPAPRERSRRGSAGVQR